MPPIVWDEVGKRTFEIGVDRCVVAYGGQSYAWNGIISVKEKKPTAKVESYYLDGSKYLDRKGGEDYEATIEAYTYPTIISQLEGTEEVNPGVSITGQTPKSFNMTYRSGIGNDVEGIGFGYKIHFLYNVTITANDKNYSTLSSTINPTIFSWTIRAVPINVPGVGPVPEVVIDTPNLPPEMLPPLEDIIYGPPIGEVQPPEIGGGDDPYFPDPGEIIDWTDPEGPGIPGTDTDSFIVITDIGSGRWTASGPDHLIIDWGDGTFDIDEVDATDNGNGTFTISTTHLS